MGEKFLGGASDPGEWWVDKPSKADDLGPGVTFRLRVACEDHLPPRIVAAYGLREDVRRDRVEAEAQRIIYDYAARKPGLVFGDFVMPPITRWRSLSDVIASFEEEAPKYGPAWPVRDILFGCTGSGPMSNRVIELVGLDALQKMIEEAP